MGCVVELFQKGSERCRDLKDYREYAMACATTRDDLRRMAVAGYAQQEFGARAQIARRRARC